MEKAPLFLEILDKNMEILEHQGELGEIYVKTPKFSDFFDLIILHPMLINDVEELYEVYFDKTKWYQTEKKINF